MPFTELVTRMAQELAGSGANLGDDGQCMRVLLHAPFSAFDIVFLIDKARIEANNIRALGGVST